MSAKIFVCVLFCPLGLMLYAPIYAAPLPEGNSGIASHYQNDSGIGSDPEVILFDGFESYSSLSDLSGRWENVVNGSYMRIAAESGNFFEGSKGLEMKVPANTSEISVELNKRPNPTRDTLFIRFYSKFDSGYNSYGSVHNNCGMSSSYWDGTGSGPGIPADGYNKFCVTYETERPNSTTTDPGKLDVYIYHPDQVDVYGDHFYPNGTIVPSNPSVNFGPEFIPRPNITPELGRWYCYELMVKANTPGLKDGRIALWLDGALVADFMNIRLRETTDLKIDQVGVNLYIKSNRSAEAKKYYDNIVIAASYIGPINKEPVVSDITPPVISAVMSNNVTASEATITWITDENASSQVEYGQTAVYGSQTNMDSSLKTGHSMNLSGLISNTLYHFRVKSGDSSGNLNSGTDETFTTKGAGEVSPGVEMKVYPNPYRLSNASSMRFSLSSLNGGGIKIYTLSGKLVKNISVTSGNTDALWNMTNEGGNRINGGLYVYIMSDSDGNKKTGKIVITN